MIKNTKYALISIVVAFIIVIASGYCFVSKDKKSYSFYYNIEIQSFVTINSSVIVPIPDFLEDEEYWINILLTESIQQGDMNAIVVHTEYGRGLMVNTSSNCRLNLTLNKKVPADNLTMTLENLGNKFYVNYDNTTSLLSLDLDFNNFEIIDSIKYGHYDYIHIYPTPNGWFDSGGFAHDRGILP